MPYVKKDQRNKYNDLIEKAAALLHSEGSDAREINYFISSIVTKLWNLEQRYKNANSLIGVLECVKLELYREHIAKYEEVKKEENGPII